MKKSNLLNDSKQIKLRMESKHIIHPLYPVSKGDDVSYFKKNGKEIVYCPGSNDKDQVSRFMYENMSLLQKITKHYLFIYSFEFVDDDAERYFFSELKKREKIAGTIIMEGCIIVGKKIVTITRKCFKPSKEIDALIDDASRNNFWLPDYCGKVGTIVFKNEESRAQFVNELVELCKN